MSQEQDKAFFINFSIVIILLALMIVFFAILGLIYGGNMSAESREAAEVAMMKNTEPVGKVRIEGDMPAMEEEAVAEVQDPVAMTEVQDPVAMTEVQAPVAMTEGDLGESTYNGLCATCHGSGIPTIPQLGDVANWAPRIAQGNELLYERAINGYVGESGMPMPAKGGDVSLSDEAVKAAVDYIVVNSQ